MRTLHAEEIKIDKILSGAAPYGIAISKKPKTLTVIFVFVAVDWISITQIVTENEDDHREKVYYPVHFDEKGLFFVFLSLKMAISDEVQRFWWKYILVNI